MARARLRGDRIANLGRIAIAWIAIVLALVAINVVVPQMNGWQVFLAAIEQLIVLTAVLAIPFALLARSQVGYVVVALLVVVTLARYGPQWISFPPNAEPDMFVTSWNVEGGEQAADRVLSGLSDVNSDLVGLVEFQPEMEQAIKTDVALSGRYPYAVFAPHDGSTGAALLSRYQIAQQQSSTSPTYIRAVVQPPWLTGPLVVYVVHPLAPDVQRSGVFPRFDTSQRTQDQATMRALIDADLAAGQTVLVMGDLNTTEREQAYSAFTAGLHDAHLDAGTGPGLTWRPDELKSLPFGLIRIDYVLTSAQLVALSSTVKCTDLSDHCQVWATFASATPSN